MNLTTNSLEFELVYPDGDGKPMTESDPTRDYLIYAVESLNIYFQERSDVYVSGNLFIYYKQGVPDAVISPDVFVVFGVKKKKRRSYKVWEEGGVTPRFVLEITSRSTQENDERDKPQKYRQLGVLEYFQYDPTGDYLQPPLKGSRLVEGGYQPIAATQTSETSLTIYSQALNLELRVTDGTLRFYAPQTGRPLLSHAETEQARQQAELERQQAELERQQAELQRQREAEARQQAELERQREAEARRSAIPRLLALGLDAAQVAEALGIPIDEV
jgi:Uma2 family endonuclease